MATSGICGKLRELQRICEDGGELVPTTIVDVTDLSREGVEVKRKNATVPRQLTNLDAELVEVRAAGRTIRSQVTAAEDWIRTLKP